MRIKIIIYIKHINQNETTFAILTNQKFAIRSGHWYFFLFGSNYLSRGWNSTNTSQVFGNSHMGQQVMSPVTPQDKGGKTKFGRGRKNFKRVNVQPTLLTLAKITRNKNQDVSKWDQGENQHLKIKQMRKFVNIKQVTSTGLRETEHKTETL